MPLKELVINELDEIDPKALSIGAVNTIAFKKGRLIGYNTDGIGALGVIEEMCSVSNKRIIILGAGGAAKAIAYEALQRGGLVTILNRDKERALELAKNLDCVGMGLDEMAACTREGYDILINCTPTMPIDPTDILPNAIVMDVVILPKETKFLEHAIENGCKIVYGYQMFVEQALGQYKIWLGEQIDLQECKKSLEASTKNL